MGGLSSLVWKYILTGFPGYLREGGCKLRHSPLHFPPLSPIIISIAFTFLLTRYIYCHSHRPIIHHKTRLPIIKDTTGDLVHFCCFHKSNFIDLPELCIL